MILPKKNGVTKTFSFDRDIVDMLDCMCKQERRTQTNLIELMVIERHNKLKNRGDISNGKTEN